MKWLRTIILFDQGDVISTADWKSLHESYVRSIESVQHPPGSGQLTLRRKKPSPDTGKMVRNGVGPLRTGFLEHIRDLEGWEPEGRVDLGDRPPTALRLYPSLQEHVEKITSKFGGFDLVTKGDGGTQIAIEWETGNISSSHRSMNKLAIALGAGQIQVGVLIVPSRALYDELTDRIGNIGELSGYLSMWEGLKSTVAKGLLAISVVEHDALTDDEALPYLKAGDDGRAAQGRGEA